jgi:amino acid transporter
VIFIYFVIHSSKFGNALLSIPSLSTVTGSALRRILFGMARKNSLPLSFAKLHQTRQTPWFASIVTSILATCLLPLNKVKVLVSISSIAIMIVFIAVHIALITLRCPIFFYKLLNLENFNTSRILFHDSGSISLGLRFISFEQCDSS